LAVGLRCVCLSPVPYDLDRRSLRSTRGTASTTSPTRPRPRCRIAVNPQISHDFAYTYPAPASAHPHSPAAIGGFNLTTDANGNQIATQDTGTGDVNQYLFDEENRLSCADEAG
jgi:hypothetical protein